MKKIITVCLVLVMTVFFTDCHRNVSSYKNNLLVELGPEPRLVFNRYEEVLFNLDTSRFQQELMAIQGDFRPFLEGDLSDPAAIKYLKEFAMDSVSVSLYHKVKEIYPDLQEIKKIVSDVYRHFYYYYPSVQLPQRIYTCVSGVSPDTPSVLLFDDALVISLDWYLDGDQVYDLTGMPKYLVERTKTEMLAKDLSNLLYERFLQQPHRQTNLLEEMVFAGKRLFFIEAMCPSMADETLLGYSSSQMLWADDNEGGLWADIVGRQMLYMSEYEVFRMFFADGPFTNEYSHEAPPRLGEFLGLHIVRSYMNANDCDFSDLMQNDDLQGVFLDSRYKPKK